MIESSGTTTAARPTNRTCRLKNERSFDIKDSSTPSETSRRIRYNGTRARVSPRRAAFTGPLQLFTSLYARVMTFTRRTPTLTATSHGDDLDGKWGRSGEQTAEIQSLQYLVCGLL